VQGTVAQQLGDAGGIQGGTIHHPATSSLDEILEVHHHVDVGPVAAPGVGALVVEEEAGDVDQGIGPAGGRGPLGIVVVATGQA